jgi:hypothetical protein
MVVSQEIYSDYEAINRALKVLFDFTPEDSCESAFIDFNGEKIENNQNVIFGVRYVQDCYEAEKQIGNLFITPDETFELDLDINFLQA